MTRVLSGAVLIALAIGVVWFASSLVFLLVASVLVGLGVNELVVLARASQLNVTFWPAVVPALLTAVCVGVQRGDALDVVLMAALAGLVSVILGVWRGDAHALATTHA